MNTATNPTQKFTLSVSDSCKTNEVTKITFLKLADLATFIKSAKPVEDKLHSRGVVAALFTSNIRTVGNISSVNAACLDFDEPAEGLFDAVVALLEAENIGFVAAGSWSNNGKFFVIIPFARPASIASHGATVEYIRGILGAYATFAPESGRPAQLRFVSPNAAAEYRHFHLNDAPLLEPREVAEEPETQTTIVNHAADTFADVAKPAEKRLFLLALRHNLIRAERLADYNEWSPVLFAGFRAWGIGKKRTKLTDDQAELLEALNNWSSHHEKYVKGCVESKIGDHLQAGMKTLTIQSLLKMETDTERLRYFLKEDPSTDLDEKMEMSAALTRLLGGASLTQVSHIDTTAIAAAQTERAAELAKQEAERKWALGILARMPAPTARFAEFRDIVTALSTQGQGEFWELADDDWQYFLRPIPMILSLVQIAALGFAPHVMFRLGEGVSPKALNLFFLHIAAAGTGKSEAFKNIHAVLEHTIFRHNNPREKLHSATGLWVNHFQRTGSLQFMTSEEAESLFGKFGNIDQHLAALHTCVKELFDKGVPGQTYRPSAQVQREIEEIVAPTLMLNLAGTPRLLNGDITETMLGDGFMSRVIAYINDKDPSLTTAEEVLAAKLKLMESTEERGADANAVRAAEFFRELWKAGNHPAGAAIFDAPEDADRDFLIGVIREHFDRADLPVRYIRPGRNKADRMRAADLGYKAECRYPIPRGLIGTPAAEAISSLRTRAELKLNMLTSLLTLIADPLAEYLNLELMAWAEELLFCAQRDFYNHLVGGAHTLTSILPKYRINMDMVAKLRPAVQPGGILFGGDLVSSNDLRNFSRAWRAVVSDLKTDPNGDRSRIAHEMLYELGVGYTDGEKNLRTFYIKPEEKDGE